MDEYILLHYGNLTNTAQLTGNRYEKMRDLYYRALQRDCNYVMFRLGSEGGTWQGLEVHKSISAEQIIISIKELM